MFPGDPSGGAAEVVNCRCSLLERARCALDAAELEHLKERAEYFGLDKAEQFEDFKKRYLTASKTADMQQYFPDARPPRDYDGITATKEKEKGKVTTATYDVNDLQISPEDESKVLFSLIISYNALKLTVL